MGTIVILFVYFLTTLALPIFMWRRHRPSFSVLRHIAIPVLGALTLIVPFIELCKRAMFRRPAPVAPRTRSWGRRTCATPALPASFA